MKDAHINSLIDLHHFKDWSSCLTWHSLEIALQMSIKLAGHSFPSM